MKRETWLPALLLAAAAGVLLVGTRRDLSEPHLRLFSDMVRSPAYHSQSENRVFRNGMTLQAPPAGTIPQGFTPFHYEPTAEDRERAGRELKNPFGPGLDDLARGKQVFDRYCQHCHGPRGLGDGAVARAFPAFSFPVASPSSGKLPDGTLFHVISYGRNLMPSAASQVSQEDRWKVVLYLRDLQRAELARLGPSAVIPEDPRRRTLVSEAYGKELFAENCASCHGEEGRAPKPGIPTLHSPAVLAIAEDAYYWEIINHGRPGTQMPAWKDVLTRTQIQSVVMHIRSWASPTPDVAQAAHPTTDAAAGRQLFATHCVGCHGPEGKGGIGNSLRAPSFLAAASDSLLAATVSLGRRHTAMPSSYDLEPKQVQSLAAYIRGFSKPSHTSEEAAALVPGASAKGGRQVFLARCAGCHGEKGEGGLGSRLNAASFLRMVDDAFLVRVIDEGRPGTAMPSWRFLPAKDVADVAAFIRSWQKEPSLALSTEPVAGRAEFGEVLFKRECVKCHGPAGGGDLGMQIANPALLTQTSDRFLFETIANGKTGTEMKGFLHRTRNPLSEEDIGHLVAYLRRLQANPPASPLQRTASWASAAEGKKVYEQKANCAKCHGLHGEGASGPALGNPAFLNAATNGFLTATIILGRENTAMHSYYNGDGPHLEDEDIENVVTYLRTFESQTLAGTRRVDRTPQAVAMGRGLFARSCSPCHGRAGEGKHGTKEGDFAPSLNNPEFLKAADDNFLLATIAMGRPGTPMRAFGDGMNGKAGLSADQIRAVVAFLRSWEKPR